jgi:hypothetical protein
MPSLMLLGEQQVVHEERSAAFEQPAVVGAPALERSEQCDEL